MIMHNKECILHTHCGNLLDSGSSWTTRSPTWGGQSINCYLVTTNISFLLSGVKNFKCFFVVDQFCDVWLWCHVSLAGQSTYQPFPAFIATSPWGRWQRCLIVTYYGGVGDHVWLWIYRGGERTYDCDLFLGGRWWCLFASLQWGERGHVCLRVGRGGDDVWLRLHLGGCGHGSASRLRGCWRTWRGCQWQSSWWENEDGDNYDEDWGKKTGVNVKNWQFIEISGQWQVKVTEKKKEKDCSPLPDLLLLLSSRTFVKEITLVESTGGQF